MRVVIQRVSSATVSIGGSVHSSIGNGMLILLGIEYDDGTPDIEWLIKKIVSLRIFPDGNGVMNVNVMDAGGDILVVSQFTLHASTKKGNRPSYIRAAPERTAVPLYEDFVRRLEDVIGKEVPTGVFGADMQVSLVNDGPVTIIIDSKSRE